MGAVQPSPRRGLYRALATGVGARGLQALSTFLVTPLVLHRLGKDDFGVWSVCVTLSVVLVLLDFGLGNSVLTAVAEADGAGRYAESKRIGSSALALTVGGSGSLLIIATAVIWALPRTWLPGSSSPAQVRWAALVVAVSYVCSTIGQLAQRLQIARLRADTANLAQGIAAVSVIAGVALVVAAHGNLLFCVVAAVVPPALVLLLNAAFVYLVQFPDLRPRLQHLSRRTMFVLVRKGSRFLVLQVLAVVTLNIDNVVVAAVLGARAVADFVVPYRIALLVPTVCTVAAYPVWALFTRALARNDARYVERNYRRAMVVALGVGAGAAVVLALAGQSLARLWVGDSVNPSELLVFSLAVWTLLATVNGTLVTVLNSCDALGVQIRWGFALLCVKFGLAPVLMSAWGVSGLVIASTIALLFCSVVPYVLTVPRYIDRAARIAPESGAT